MLNSQTKQPPSNAAISSQSVAGDRIAPLDNVLEDRFLHQLFLLMHVPATWPAWKLGLGLLVTSMVVWLFWLPVGYALAAAALYLLFAAGDWLLLWWLSHSGRSFGPVGPQLFTMIIPRLGVALLSAILAGLSGSIALGFAALFVLQLCGSITYVWATLYEPFALGVTRQKLQVSGLPVDAPHIRLLHLSDLHVERLTSREHHLLELVKQIDPEIIVVTGDYLNLSYVDDPVARAEVRKVLEKLSAPYGVYATLGSPPVDPRNTTPFLFDGLNIRLLRDEMAVIDMGQNRTLTLLGMDCEHDLESDASVLHKLAELAPNDSARVLLYHSPELMPPAQQLPINLYLCGHTHGGQIRMPLYGAILTSSSTGKQYEMGRYDEQGTTLYVSRGIGLEGLGAPRMRLLCEPEIILWELSGR